MRLYMAIQSNNIEGMKTAFAEGADATDKYAMKSALQSIRSLETARTLVEDLCADPNAMIPQDIGGDKLAITVTNVDKMRLLIRNGADVNMMYKRTQNWQWTALHYFAIRCDLARIEILVNEGKADVSVKNSLGETPWQTASQSTAGGCRDESNKAKVLAILKSG